jgi:serine/threonine protein kinase
MPLLPVLPEPGQLIAGKYLLVRLLGDGGMARVYEAQHQRLGIPVALKFLHPRLARFPALVERFLQEARIVARIRSPRVVQVLDVDQDEHGLPFLVLEHLAGSTLRARADAAPERRLPVGEALLLASQLCEGLEAVHAAGIVHRDLKPDNVMILVGPSGAPRVELLDFGIALPEAAAQGRGEAAGAVLGTPEYMAPEQLSSADGVDLRADLFSVGVLIYEMLAGRLPAFGEAPAAIAARHRDGRIPRLDQLVPAIAPELVAVIHRAMAPRAEDRFASASALREAIAPWIPAACAAPTPTPVVVSIRGSSTLLFDPGDALPTTVEAPWFTVEPGPTPAPPSAPSPQIWPTKRRWPLVAGALGVVLAGALGMSMIALAPVAGGKGRTQPDLALALLAAPSTEVEADPPAPSPVPEVTPASPSSLPVRVAPRPAAPSPKPVTTTPASLPPTPPALIEAPRVASPIVTPSCHGAPRDQTRAASREPAKTPPREARREPPRPPERQVEQRVPELVFATPPPRPMVPLDPPSPPRRRVLRFVPLVTVIR